MTDASFIARMGSDRVIDRVAAPRRVRQRVVNNFQAAWRPRPRTYNVGRWWTKEKIAHVCLVGYVTGLILVVWSVMAVREWLP